MILSTEQIKVLKENKNLITSEILSELRKTKEGKSVALEILDIERDNEDYYLDAFGSRISFNGNRQIKPFHTKINLSDIHIQEIKRCSEDIDYFKNNYVQFRTKSGIGFPDHREYQEKFIHSLNNTNEQYLVVFPRQAGKSATTAVWLTWLFLFKEQINIGICANRGSTATDFLANVKNIYTCLPIWLQQGIKVWNVKRIEGENGTRILTDATSGDSFRGSTMNVVVVDECIEYNSIITLKNKTTGEIKDIKIGDFYNLQEQKNKLKELVLKKYDDLDSELLDEYLDFCLFSNTENDKKIERHHILPKSLFKEYSKNTDNITKLSPQNHYLAHEFLVRIFKNSIEMMHAFNLMCNTKHNKKTVFISKEDYEKIKNKLYENQSKNFKGYTVVYDSLLGKNVFIHKSEVSKEPQRYLSTFKNKLSALNNKTGKLERITSDEYEKNKNLYSFHSRGKAKYFDLKTQKFCYINVSEKTEDMIYVKSRVYVLRDNKEVITRLCDIKNTDIVLRKFIKEIKKNAKPILFDEHVKAKNRFIKLQLKKERSHAKRVEKRKEYLKTLNLEYKPHVVTVKKEKCFLVRDVLTGKNCSITKNEFLNNLDRYVGINKSKIRVKNIETNKIQMINKEDFDPLIHTTDYDKSIFGHKNKITKKSKIITLFDNKNNIIISDYWINYETRLRELNLNIDVDYLKNRFCHHRNVFSINGYENWRIQ